MSTSKHFNAICAVVLALALAVTVLFMNGEKLGIQVIRDEDSEENESSQYFTANDQNTGWTAATTITLNGDTAALSGPGAYANGGSVTITAAGYYDVTGTLTDGSLIVDAGKNAKVFIRLNGVYITCADDAAIRVNQADKVFLTLAEGTENAVTSGEAYSETALADKTDGTIFSHDDLTINGSGSLTVTAAYKHGIAANDSLRITGGSITVTAPADTIHVNDTLRITGASLTLTAGDDAIHSDTSIAILGGSITVTDCYEGIEALEILIEDGDITVTSTDDGINACGTQTADGNLPSVTINGGTVTLLNPSGRDADGIDSNGNIDIGGGLVYISLVGDGSNCALDYGSENGGVCRINGGTVVACGGSSMLETMSENSAQPSLLYAGANQAAGTEITLEQVAATYGVTGGMGGRGGPGGARPSGGSEDTTDADTQMPTPPSGSSDNSTSTLPSDNSNGSAPTPPSGGSAEDFTPPDGAPPARPDGGIPAPADDSASLPAQPGDDGQAPADAQNEQASQTDQAAQQETFTLSDSGKRLLLVSAAALLLGLLAAILYRKRG